MRARSLVTQIVGLTIVYFAAARFSLSIGSLPGNISAVWPPAGIAIAALVLGGRALWPGVFLGALLANLVGPLPWTVATGMATGNTLEAVAACWLLSRRRTFAPALTTSSDVIAFVTRACIVSTAISATIGVGCLLAGDIIPVAAVARSWVVWWVGDALGVLIVGSTLLVWLSSGAGPHRRRLEAALAFPALAGCTVIAFGPTGYPYLVFPFVVWAAFRYTQRGAVSAMLVISAIAVTRTASGSGPFATGGSTNHQLWTLDFFIGVVALTALMLATVVTERDNSAARLEETNSTLEQRVRDRTAALEYERARLEEAQQVGHIGSWEWDVIQDTVTWSDELYRLFGLERGDVDTSYASYLSLLPPDDQERMDRLVQHAYATGESYELAHRVVASDGAVRWIRGRGQVTRDQDGRVTRMSGTAQDITDTVNLQDDLASQARHDALTGLPNRVLLTERLQASLTADRPRAGQLAVIFLDIDRFKWVNDSLGHTAGDRVLTTVASRLAACTRPGDTIARFGGDEFVVLCQGLSTAAPDALALADRLRAALTEPLDVDGILIPLSASVGIAVAEADSTPERLLRDADVAMYRAKDRGGACAVLFDETLHGQVQTRIATASALHAALGNHEIVTHYQPIMDLGSGAVIGVEALARWQDPERGLLAPDSFIDVAEQSGLIVPLGQAVLTQACQDVASWNLQRGPDERLSVAVNVSARQLLCGHLAEDVAAVLARSGLSADLLVLELTETALMDDVAATTSTVEALRALGVRLSVDDFGTGYSSLLYLRRFPVSALKIDRSFVQGLGVESDDTAIVTGVIELARGLGLTAVAEGVETPAQLDLLQRLGCPQAQGWHWSKALPADELQDWLAAVPPGASIPPPRTTAPISLVV